MQKGSMLLRWRGYLPYLGADLILNLVEERVLVTQHRNHTLSFAYNYHTEVQWFHLLNNCVLIGDTCMSFGGKGKPHL